MPSVNEFAQITAIVEQAYANTMRKFLVRTWRDLTVETPVDTGRARASWVIKANDSPYSDRGTTIKDQSISDSKIRESDIWYILSNVPYMESLNRGHSQQAPSGFINTIVQRNVAKING